MNESDKKALDEALRICYEDFNEKHLYGLKDFILRTRDEAWIEGYNKGYKDAPFDRRSNDYEEDLIQGEKEERERIANLPVMQYEEVDGGDNFQFSQCRNSLRREIRKELGIKE